MSSPMDWKPNTPPTDQITSRGGQSVSPLARGSARQESTGLTARTSPKRDFADFDDGQRAANDSDTIMGGTSPEAFNHDGSPKYRLRLLAAKAKNATTNRVTAARPPLDTWGGPDFQRFGAAALSASSRLGLAGKSALPKWEFAPPTSPARAESSLATWQQPFDPDFGPPQSPAFVAARRPSNDSLEPVALVEVAPFQHQVIQIAPHEDVHPFVVASKRLFSFSLQSAVRVFNATYTAGSFAAYYGHRAATSEFARQASGHLVRGAIAVGQVVSQTVETGAERAKRRAVEIVGSGRDYQVPFHVPFIQTVRNACRRTKSPRRRPRSPRIGMTSASIALQDTKSLSTPSSSVTMQDTPPDSPSHGSPVLALMSGALPAPPSPDSEQDPFLDPPSHVSLFQNLMSYVLPARPAPVLPTRSQLVIRRPRQNVTPKTPYERPRSRTDPTPTKYKTPRQSPGTPAAGYMTASPDQRQALRSLYPSTGFPYFALNNSEQPNPSDIEMQDKNPMGTQSRVPLTENASQNNGGRTISAQNDQPKGKNLAVKKDVQNNAGCSDESHSDENSDRHDDGDNDPPNNRGRSTQSHSYGGSGSHHGGENDASNNSGGSDESRMNQSSDSLHDGDNDRSNNPGSSDESHSDESRGSHQHHGENQGSTDTTSEERRNVVPGGPPSPHVTEAVDGPAPAVNPHGDDDTLDSSLTELPDESSDGLFPQTPSPSKRVQWADNSPSGQPLSHFKRYVKGEAIGYHQSSTPVVASEDHSYAAQVLNASSSPLAAQMAALEETTLLGEQLSSLSMKTRSGRQLQEKREKEAEEARKTKEAKEKAEKEAAERAEAAELRSIRFSRVLPDQKVIRPLPAMWSQKVRDALGHRGHRDLAWTSTGQAITRHDMGTLLPGPGDHPDGWLNDEIINAYLQAVVDYGLQESGSDNLGRTSRNRGVIPKFHAFNSFFYSKIRDSGPGSVERWSKRANIQNENLLSVERVFIPVHQLAHWTLLVVSPKARTIEYFDSLNGDNTVFVKNAKKWLANELRERFVEEEWIVGDGESPNQLNTVDCGVFAVTTAKMIALGINPLAYHQRDIVQQRRRMVAELLNGGFSGDFSPAKMFEGVDEKDEEEDEEVASEEDEEDDEEDDDDEDEDGEGDEDEDEEEEDDQNDDQIEDEGEDLDNDEDENDDQGEDGPIVEDDEDDSDIIEIVEV
ncbi:MAG: hypothetical protein M4579_004687 [Chaenotheca gracillima]|nr:MAG: hypothetical protein M4579_004687 [Chaenotheca gracillima]